MLGVLEEMANTWVNEELDFTEMDMNARFADELAAQSQSDLTSTQSLTPTEPILDAISGEAETTAPSGKKTKQGNKYNRWCFTINNPGGYEPIFKKEDMKYLVFQLESGENQTMHFQGYVRFAKRIRMTAAKKYFTKETHLESALGTEEECRNYCTKEETRVIPGKEYGTYHAEIGNGRGQRTDIIDIADDCRSGKTILEIASEHPSDFVRYHQGILALHDLLAPSPPAIRPVQLLVLWGATGTGKSYRMATQFPNAYKVKPGRGPWDGYRNQDIVWFDEFNWEKWDIFEMNEYLDQYMCPLPCRYHDRFASWTKVVICSNSDPTTWYRNADMTVVNAFRRRLGANCRHVLTRTQEISDLVPNPDFSYLVPPPFKADEETVVPDSQAPSH